MIALQFLTVLPAPFNRRAAATISPAAVDYFALVGLVVGLILAATDVLLSAIFPPSVTAALIIAIATVLTGALHLDGLADTCDGIFNRGEPERRLEIMRDSRTGAFGVVGLALLLLVKYGALTALPAPAPLDSWDRSWSILVRPSALILMATAARLAMAYAVVYFPYARPTGLGKLVQARQKASPLAINTAVVALIAYLLLGGLGIASLAASGLVVWLGALYIMSKIPGLTGDTYGALCEVAEAAILLVVVAGT